MPKHDLSRVYSNSIVVHFVHDFNCRCFFVFDSTNWNDDTTDWTIFRWARPVFSSFIQFSKIWTTQKWLEINWKKKECATRKMCIHLNLAVARRTVANGQRHRLREIVSSHFASEKQTRLNDSSFMPFPNWCNASSHRVACVRAHFSVPKIYGFIIHVC